MTSTIISTNGKRIETRCNPSNYRVRCSKTGEWHKVARIVRNRFRSR